MMTDLMQSTGFQYQHVTIIEDKELGRGVYGRVCRASCDELPSAAKLLNPKLFQFSDDLVVKSFKEDCKLLIAISHPSIVQYLDAYIQPETRRAVLLMELLDESLTDFLDRLQNPLPMHLQIDICHDMIQALAYLHSINITHRNLTGKNVLINAGSRAKVTDFMMMKMADAQQAANPHFKHMTIPDSSGYMPPEAFRFPPSYTNMLDIFSFGVVCLQVITKQFPHPSSYKISEIERRRSDLNSVDPGHPMLAIVMSCLKDRDIIRPPATQLCRKFRQLQNTPMYAESQLKREIALEEIEGIRIELDQLQKKNKQLASQLESVHIENEQLCRLISKHSESISSNVKLAKPFGVPEDYLEIDDPSLLDDGLESQMDLSAPHPALWYHGSIKRDTACMRLQGMSKPGAYLVRTSESEPGSYVLSFLDKQLRVFNYKIACRNGQYNAQGQSKKWFSSLGNLIGYYTRHSTVKQNQHLDIPVAPPEVVPLPIMLKT